MKSRVWYHRDTAVVTAECNYCAFTLRGQIMAVKFNSVAEHYGSGACRLQDLKRGKHWVPAVVGLAFEILKRFRNCSSIRTTTYGWDLSSCRYVVL